MRRLVGPILVGVGAFLLVAAVLVKFYAYPQLAVAPIDQDSVTHLEATNATVFDSATLEEINTTLSVATTTRGDVEASKDAGDDIRVWTGTTTVTSADGVVRSQGAERAAFDSVSGEAVNCCGGFDESEEGERTEVKREGLVYKFPFNTQKKDYEFWDSTLGEAIPAKYTGEDEVLGVKVYVFVTTTEPTVVGQREVPGSIMGLDDDAVMADTVYANTRTMYIEPATGAVLDRLEEQKQTLAIDGEDKVTTTEADLRFTKDQVADMVDQVDGQASLLALARGTLPLLLLVFGLLLLAGGIVLTRRNQPDRTDPAPVKKHADAGAGV